jgi:hypothetical protein
MLRQHDLDEASWAIYSSDYTTNPSLRPKLVVTYSPTVPVVPSPLPFAILLSYNSSTQRLFDLFVDPYTSNNDGTRVRERNALSRLLPP